MPRNSDSEVFDDELVKAGEEISSYMSSSGGSVYELPRFPIEEREEKAYFERQLSHR